jgi:hypothetical protein
VCCLAAARTWPVAVFHTSSRLSPPAPSSRRSSLLKDASFTLPSMPCRQGRRSSGSRRHTAYNLRLSHLAGAASMLEARRLRRTSTVDVSPPTPKGSKCRACSARRCRCLQEPAHFNWLTAEQAKQHTMMCQALPSTGNKHVYTQWQLTWSARRTGRVPPWSSGQQCFEGAQLASCIMLSFA